MQLGNINCEFGTIIVELKWRLQTIHVQCLTLITR